MCLNHPKQHSCRLGPWQNCPMKPVPDATLVYIIQTRVTVCLSETCFLFCKIEVTVSFLRMLLLGLNEQRQMCMKLQWLFQTVSHTW